MQTVETERRWRVILNPAAGRGQGAAQRERLEVLLAKHAPPNGGWWVGETTRRGEARELARAAREAGFTGVAAAGGDGTLGEALDGIYGENENGTAIPRLAVLPLGTGNDFSRCLGLGTDLEAAVQAMWGDNPRRIDIGRVSIDDRTRYFVNVAGCGFDAVVAERINRGFRRLRGTPAYLAAMLGTLGSFRPAPVRIVADGEVRETKAMLCAVANATSYGGGMLVTPDAKLDDGLFDICIIGDAGRLEFLRAFPRVFKGTHVTHRNVSMLCARQVRIESEVPLPVLADGEIVGTTAVEFEIVPGAVEVMGPKIVV